MAQIMSSNGSYAASQGKAAVHSFVAPAGAGDLAGKVVDAPKGADTTSFANIGRRCGPTHAFTGAHTDSSAVLHKAAYSGPSNFTTIGRRASPPSVSLPSAETGHHDSAPTTATTYGPPSFTTIGRRCGPSHAFTASHADAAPTLRKATYYGPTNFTTVGRRAGPPRNCVEGDASHDAYVRATSVYGPANFTTIGRRQ